MTTVRPLPAADAPLALPALPDTRGRGHVRALLAWLEQEARRLGCASLHLDSGVGENRFAAHPPTGCTTRRG